MARTVPMTSQSTVYTRSGKSMSTPDATTPRGAALDEPAPEPIHPEYDETAGSAAHSPGLQEPPREPEALESGQRAVQPPLSAAEEG
jgi:hypothetical protein